MDFEQLKIQIGTRGDTRSLQTQEHQSNGHEEHDVDPNHNHEHPAFEALDKNYGGFSFSAGAVYNLEKYTFRFNAASGFRAPTASELLSNGSHGGTGRYEIGNPNLKSEYATQFDFSVAYKNEHFQFEINPFFNSIQNYIYINPTGEEIEHNPAYVYTQKNAFLYGGELGLHYHPHQVHWLHLEADFSSVFAEDYDGNALPLIPQNKINTMARAAFSSKKNFRLKSAFVQYTHRFAQNRVVAAIETVSPAYGLTNVGLNFEAFSAKKPLEINLGVNNLFNVSYIDHLSRYKQKGIPNIGLNAYIGLKYNFGYKI